MKKNETEKVTKILWVSIHTPLPRQIEALKKIFGQIKITLMDEKFYSAEQIINVYQAGKYDEMVVVAPLSVIHHIIKEGGIYPLWAQMEICEEKDKDVTYRGRHYKFVEWKRIQTVEFKFFPKVKI